MAAVDNTIVYAQEWVTKLQERLSEETKWKDICRVEYTNFRVLNNPYLTDPTVQTNTRGCPYTYQRTLETNDTITISTSKILPMAIDRGDLAQSTFMRQMDMAERQATLLDEAIEAAVMGAYTQATDFGSENLTGSTGSSQITVSNTNIDDIIRNMKTQIRSASGESMMNRYGAFIIWRPADFEKLEAFMQANGYMTADSVLRNGAVQGLRYMGVDHYSSNQLTANHNLGGVKKAIHLGILKDTYGQVMIDEKDPGQLSGIAVVSRVDYAVKVWNNNVPIVFDINVA